MFQDKSRTFPSILSSNVQALGSSETVALSLDCRLQSLVLFVEQPCTRRDRDPPWVEGLTVKEEVDIYVQSSSVETALTCFSPPSLSSSASHPSRLFSDLIHHQPSVHQLKRPAHKIVGETTLTMSTSPSMGM